MTDAQPDAQSEATAAELEHLFGPVTDGAAVEELNAALPETVREANSRRRRAKEKVVLEFDPMQGVYVDAKTKIPVPKKLRMKPHRVLPHQLNIDFRSVYDKRLDMIIDKDNIVITRDAEGYHQGNAGRKSLGIRPRVTYRKNTYWRVVGENVRVEAMCLYGKNTSGEDIWSGWSRVIPVGTVLECIGWRRFRKDGLVAPQFHFDGLPREAQWSQVWPLDSVWRPWPLQGILEKIMPGDADYPGNLS